MFLSFVSRLLHFVLSDEQQNEGQISSIPFVSSISSGVRQRRQILDIPCLLPKLQTIIRLVCLLIITFQAVVIAQRDAVISNRNQAVVNRDTVIRNRDAEIHAMYNDFANDEQENDNRIQLLNGIIFAKTARSRETAIHDYVTKFSEDVEDYDDVKEDGIPSHAPYNCHDCHY